MSFATAKITEMPLRISLPLSSHRYPSSLNILFSSSPKPSFHILLLKPLSSLRTTEHGGGKPSQKPPPPSNSAPWLNKWPSRTEQPPRQKVNEQVKEPSSAARQAVKEKGGSAVERIVFRLRNLGLDDDDEDDVESDGQDSISESLGDLLKREWVRPDYILAENDGADDVALPWEKEEEEKKSEGEEEVRGGMRKQRRSRATSVAEMTIEEEELKRLRRMGMVLRVKINVPQAGMTQAVLDKIHERWRKEELVRLKFHEVLATDMKTAHVIVERRTGGLVLWRSGSVMVVYRGKDYKGPLTSEPAGREGDAPFISDVSKAETSELQTGNGVASADNSEQAVKIQDPVKKIMTNEEVEFNNLLDSLGPRFVEWWGTGVLPVDADLLPKVVPGYKTPFRLLPTGMRSRLTNVEMTNLRKLARSIPCHFALGRNRNHQGLASAILKVWETSSVVKIAVKRGIQNTNNKLMADELKTLTGGVLLLRNKYYIVFYRGKDFIPTSVGVALAERQELTKQVQDVEEKVRIKAIEATSSVAEEGHALAGTLAEFYEAQARWGREISAEEREKMIEENKKVKVARRANQIEHKLSVAQAKKLRAETLLSKIESTMLPAGPDYDQETITDEERVMFRRLGLKMTAYLPLGIRGVFDGVIENMHLHWKHRELVKLITKQKTLAFVEDSARLLEYESGGILVAIERIPKGYALIYYRGKNYQRPITIRPRNLLTKAKALKRSVAMQRHEALSQHITELERTIDQMRSEIGAFDNVDNESNWSSRDTNQINIDSEFIQSEDEVSDMDSDVDEASHMDSDYNGNEDSDWENED